MRSFTLREVADEIGVPLEDVFTVSEAELHDPEQYDPERGTVTEQGREAIITHFQGGTDPG